MVDQSQVDGPPARDQADGRGAIGRRRRRVPARVVVDGDAAGGAGGQGDAEERARSGIGAIDIPALDDARTADQAALRIQGQAPQLLVWKTRGQWRQQLGHRFGRLQHGTGAEIGER